MRIKRLIVTLSLALSGILVTSGGTPVHATGPCYPNPSAAGCGFPDATNTGVESSHLSSLVPFSGTKTISSGGLSCGTPTVVQDLDITGKLVINANNVSVQNVRINASGLPAIVAEVDGSKNCVTFSHVTIIGDGQAGQVCFKNGGTSSRSNFINMSGCEIGATANSAGGLWLVDSYIHGLLSSSMTPSFAGILVNGGPTAYNSQHNTIAMGTSGYGVSWTSADGSVGVTHSLIHGGTYNIYVHATGTPASGAILGNRLDIGSSGYVLRNISSLTTSDSTYPFNYDDFTDANINSSL